MTSRRGRISIGQAATVLANVGVLIGLIFVIVELRQNQLNLRAEIELSIAESYQVALGRTLENSEIAALMQTAFLTPDSLDSVQFVQLMAWNAEWMAILFATYRLKELGAVSEDTWTQHARYFAFFLQTEWMRDFWRATNEDVYPDEFVDAISRLLPEGSLSGVPDG